jgi:DNA-binding transcriptional ArsR family regulator
MAPSPTQMGDLTGLRLDAAALKVLAHPLRSRLLGALRVDGPATATDLATRLKTNSGATSYHLRKLESVGLVSDTGEGEGKRRLWQAATDFHTWQASDFAGDEDSETALNWLVRDYARHFAEQFDRWLDVEEMWPVEWRDADGMSDHFVVTTPERVQQLKAEVDQLLLKYRRVGQGNPKARRLAVYSAVYPLDLDRVPTGRDQS